MKEKINRFSPSFIIALFVCVILLFSHSCFFIILTFVYFVVNLFQD